MVNVVIIGAGPAGLYAAIKLRKAGVKDILVCDPRKAAYTRPGFFGSMIYNRLGKGLDFKFKDEETGAHIKHLERDLYAEALRLNIEITGETFEHFYIVGKSSGIYLKDKSTSIARSIPADYVLDCTGSRRQVLSNLNTVTGEQRVKLMTVAEVPIKNHFLAYVKISPETEKNISSRAKNFLLPTDDLSDLDYASALVELRKHGWNQFYLPALRYHTFGKNKVSFTFEVPHNLSKTHKEWLDAVLKAYKIPSDYQHIESKTKKPRFTAFSTQLQALEKTCYPSEELPTVIALGDAQIDPLYTLGTGLINGAERIDALPPALQIDEEGKITSFDDKKYGQDIFRSLLQQKMAIRNEAGNQTEKSLKTRENASKRLRSAMENATNDQREDIRQVLVALEEHFEIKNQQAYAELENLYRDYLHGNQKLDSDSFPERLYQLTAMLPKALFLLTNLPRTEREKLTSTKELLGNISLNFIELGNYANKIKDYSLAVECYEKVLVIFKELGTKPQDTSIYKEVYVKLIQALAADCEERLDEHRDPADSLNKAREIFKNYGDQIGNKERLKLEQRLTTIETRVDDLKKSETNLGLQ